MKKVVENLVMVGDELHQLVEYLGEGNECKKCSLRETCQPMDPLNCSGYGENGNPMYYESLGTLTELAKKKDKRALARHYIAVLVQYNRWRRDVPSVTRQVDWLELERAIDFAVNELKEKYKKL